MEKIYFVAMGIAAFLFIFVMAWQDVKDLLPESFLGDSYFNYDEGRDRIAYSPPIYNDFKKCGKFLSGKAPLIQNNENKYCLNGNSACQAIGTNCVRIEFKSAKAFFWKKSKHECGTFELPSYLLYKAICA